VSQVEQWVLLSVQVYAPATRNLCLEVEQWVLGTIKRRYLRPGRRILGGVAGVGSD